MTVLPELERLLGDAAEHLAPANTAGSLPRGERRRSRWRWRPPRTLVLLAGLVLAGASVAWAAGVFRIGAPITTQRGYAPEAKVGWGAPLPGSFKVLPLRVPDPDGGPSWGLGVFMTTQGLACPAAGRVVNGRLGALGIAYTFADDGAFHPLLPAPAIGAGCAPPDARGHLFLSMPGWIVSASGESEYFAIASAQQPACLFPGEQNPGERRCPRSALRTVLYGFLGPDARTISYTYHGVRHVEQLVGPDRGYLIVLPAPADVTSKRAQYGDIQPPVDPRVTYRSGLSCSLASAIPMGSPGPCRTVGYQQGPLELPSRASLQTAVIVTYRSTLTVGLLPPEPALTVSFKAHASTGTRYRYSVQLQRPNDPACRSALARAGGGISLQATTSGAIRARQNITLAVPLIPPCQGRYTGTLSIQRAPRWPEPFFSFLAAPPFWMDRLGIDRPGMIPIAAFAHGTASLR